MTISYVKEGHVILILNDIAGEPIIGEKITYSVNSDDDVVGETDIYGHVYINGLNGENKITAKYAGSDSYYKSDLSAPIQASPSQTQTAIAASSLSVNAANAKGAASFSLPTATGKYGVTMAFSGDTTYKGSATTSIIINKQATKFTVAKKTFKKKATKKVTAVLKENTGKVLSGKKVTLKVNVKSYTAKTNSKGVATFKIKLTKKGTFKATTEFAADSYYTAKTTSSKIIVK